MEKLTIDAESEFQFQQLKLELEQALHHLVQGHAHPVDFGYALDRCWHHVFIAHKRLEGLSATVGHLLNFPEQPN